MIEIAGYDSYVTSERESCCLDMAHIIDDYECFIDDLCQLLGIENSEFSQTLMSNKLKNDIYKRVEFLKIMESRHDREVVPEALKNDREVFRYAGKYAGKYEV